MKNFLASIFCFGVFTLLNGCGGNLDNQAQGSKVDNQMQSKQIVNISGYHLPGTMEIAKSDGFIDCNDAYKCKKIGEVRLFDVIAESAFIEFNQADTKTYDSIVFNIPRIKLNNKCAVKAKTFVEREQCNLPSDLDKFRERLLSLGWKKDSELHSKYVAYYNPDVEIRIEIKNLGSNNVVLKHITKSELTKKLEVINNNELKQKTESDRAQVFIESMKKP